MSNIDNDDFTGKISRVKETIAISFNPQAQMILHRQRIPQLMEFFNLRLEQGQLFLLTLYLWHPPSF
ncbi:hypothetical protein [Enterovibrio coralii]|nr:hypothetical protein [Enterovibrio coralii]